MTTNIHILTILLWFCQCLFLWDYGDSLLCPDPSSVKNASSFFLGNCSLDPDLEAYWSHGGSQLSELSILGPLSPSPSELDLSLIAKAFPSLTQLSIVGIPSLLRVTFEDDEASFPLLNTLNLSKNPSLHQVCPSIFQRSGRLSFANLSSTPLQHFPFYNVKHAFASDLNQTQISCDCHLKNLSWIKRGLLPGLTCMDKNRDRQLVGSSFDNCDEKEKSLQTLVKPPKSSLQSVWSTVRLDCKVKGADVISWVVNSFSDEEERVYKTFVGYRIPGCKVRVEGHTCSALTVSDQLSDPSEYYDDARVSTLANGSLLITDFGWQDRGIYSCHATNSWDEEGQTHEAIVNLDPDYRAILYYWSLMYGFISAAGFLIVTLIVKLVYFLLENYGCCLCCCCCKDQLPPKAKKLKTAIDSIESYRDQQLERLRENYTQQSDWIRQNCAVQMERVRDNYNGQVQNLKDIKQYGTCQLVAVRQQYFDQMQRIRDYSTCQLNRVNENYIFQRQRLRKFSAQNYLKIRETRKYTQKTLTKVMDNLPALYLDLSTCRQGLGERRDSIAFDEDPNIIQCLELGNFPEELSPESSMYYTPSSTPLRPFPCGGSGDLKGGPYRDVYSAVSTPKRYRFKSKSFSNFLPLWKNSGGGGTNPPGSNGSNVETAEVVVEKENHEEDYITFPSKEQQVEEEDKESEDFSSAKSVQLDDNSPS